MWEKLKKGVATVRVPAFRIPMDEWERFRALRPGLSVSEHLRLAVREWIARNRA